jgi:hypothetical protein
VQLTASTKTIKQATGTVIHQHKDNSVVEETQNLGDPVFGHGVLAMVEVSIGVTRNLGNFESVKFNVSVTMPCAPDPESLDLTYAEAKSWVDAKIETLNAEITEQLGS